MRDYAVTETPGQSEGGDEVERVQVYQNSRDGGQECCSSRLWCCKGLSDTFILCIMLS